MSVVKCRRTKIRLKLDLNKLKLDLSKFKEMFDEGCFHEYPQILSAKALMPDIS